MGRLHGATPQAIDFNKLFSRATFDSQIVCFYLEPFFFLSYSEWHTLPSHASAEACLTDWPNAQPQGRD